MLFEFPVDEQRYSIKAASVCTSQICTTAQALSRATACRYPATTELGNVCKNSVETLCQSADRRIVPKIRASIFWRCSLTVGGETSNFAAMSR